MPWVALVFAAMAGGGWLIAWVVWMVVGDVLRELADEYEVEDEGEGEDEHESEDEHGNDGEQEPRLILTPPFRSKR